ncbi:hypothetical protein ES319_D10G250100v1 [Gossypium barbadense]|uniref:Uncharacterized protein n=1 Tax=Gossypium barbadense TaxID=3634 RepID=A0A5J5PW25_GOSBA|nr:hypothetical protein ES319_D10G250100v1 [Gossypium barbadense]
MDQSFRTISRTEDFSELYKLIQSDGNVLRSFDEVEFIETPLHVAANEGKLNQQGLKPIHLALEKGHKEMVLRFLQMDKDLVRVTGKNGETPLHYIIKVGNHDSLLETFLKACPDCIRDVTTENRSALHIAAEKKRLDVLQILIRMLKKKDYYQEEVNRKDEDGNTALHIAARNNQTVMLKLLLSSKADKHATNQSDLTALGVAEQHNNRKSIRILHGCFIPGVADIKSKWEKQIVKYTAKASSGDDTSSPGKSVLDRTDFLLFYIPTYVVFMVTFFLILALLKPFPHGLKKTIQVLLAYFAICFDQSISFIAPTDFAFKVIWEYFSYCFLF